MILILSGHKSTGDGDGGGRRPRKLSSCSAVWTVALFAKAERNWRNVESRSVHDPAAPFIIINNKKH